MIHLDSVSLYQGTSQLLQKSSASILSGQKVAIVGRNGCGKSSLFQLILGDLDCDEGRLKIDGNPLIAHIEQFNDDRNENALSSVLSGDKAYCQLVEKIEQADLQHKHEQLADLHEQMRHIDGYSAPARAASILHGLGFANDEVEKPISSFSGGWQMRIRLARALMAPSDLLMLDEPTNHLDLEALVWLENWLQNYPGTLLLISHDREFIDRVCNQIIHFDDLSLKSYKGNFSEFERLRLEQRQHQQAQIEKQQRQRQQLQSFVDRFRAKATKAKQAQSRLKKLAKMENLSLSLEQGSIHFEFKPCERLPAFFIRLDELVLGYQAQKVLEQVSQDIKPGDRIGLIGKNGQGKSTLIKHLAGELDAMGGSSVFSKDTKVSYFAQHQVEQLHPDNTPLAQLLSECPSFTDSEARTWLGRFAFSNDAALSPIGPMSGGEKSRLVLAIMVAQQPNVVLLDEPTNHLDMETRNALNLALQQFDGALILVSHDRFLLDSLCNELWLVNEGRVSLFDGSSDDYQKAVLSGLSNDSSGNRAASETSESKGSTLEGQNPGISSDRKQNKKRQAEIRQQLYPLKQKLNSLEKTVVRMQDDLAALDNWLADQNNYQSGQNDQLQQKIKQQGALRQQLQQQEELWFEQLEAYEQQERLLKPE